MLISHKRFPIGSLAQRVGDPSYLKRKTRLFLASLVGYDCDGSVMMIPSSVYEWLIPAWTVLMLRNVDQHDTFMNNHAKT